MNNTNLKEITETTPVSLMDLMECAYEEVNGFEEWIVKHCDLEPNLLEMSKDEMGDDGIWRMVFDFIEDDHDNERSYLLTLIKDAWNQLEGFKEWILKHLEIDECVSDMGEEYVQDGRDLELVLEIIGKDFEYGLEINEKASRAALEDRLHSDPEYLDQDKRLGGISQK